VFRKIARNNKLKTCAPGDRAQILLPCGARSERTLQSREVNTMTKKSSSLPLILFVLLLAWAAPGAAQPACQGFCNPLVPCLMTCTTHIYTNCLAYNGICNRDEDGDGVDITVDNCQSTYNPNQANCDGDGPGDVCDSLNGIFVATGNKIACATDIDHHLVYYTAEVKYQQKYVDTSACQSADRWNHFTYDSYCTYGWDEWDCCLESCSNGGGFSCDEDLCEPPGQYTCNPDTIP
jgi:hypothetical protein